jgi:cbb3-type cytochrome oxidase subunit 3
MLVVEVIKVVEEDPDELKAKSNVLQDMLGEEGHFRKYIKIGLIVLVLLVIAVVAFSFYKSYKSDQNTESELPQNKLPIPILSEKLKDYPDNLKTNTKEFKSLELFARNAGLFRGTGDFARMKVYVIEGTELYKNLQGTADQYKEAQQNSDSNNNEDWSVERVAKVDKPDGASADSGDIFLVATIKREYTDDRDGRINPEPLVALFRMKPSGLAEPAYKVHTLLTASSDIPQPADLCTVVELIAKYPDRQGLYGLLVKENYKNQKNIQNAVLLYYQERAKLWEKLLDSVNDTAINEQLTGAFKSFEKEYTELKNAKYESILAVTKENKDTTNLDEATYEGEDEAKTDLAANLKAIDDYSKENCDIRIT